MLNFKKKKYLVTFSSIIIILIVFATLINAKSNQNTDESIDKKCDLEISNNENSSIYGEPLELFDKAISDLEELSGIATSKKNEDTIWAHNDSSSNGEIFALDKEGNITMRVEINEFEDIEDMCIGNYNNKEYIFVGDFGDNSEEREDCIISMMEEPLLGEEISNESKDFTYVYSDGEAHNCESIGYTQYVSDGTIYLFTKEKNIKVFKLIVSDLDENEENVAEYVGELEIEDFKKPSAADISRDGTYLIIRDEKNIFKLSVDDPSNFDDILTKDVISINCPEEPNGEAITIDPNTKSLYTASEEQPKVLYEIPLN